MRVAHLTPSLFGIEGTFGGAERYTFELARYMARVTPTSLIAFSDRGERFNTSDGLEVRALGPAWRVRGQSFNRVHPGLLPAIADADVIHCHQPHTLAAELAALVARVGRRIVVATDLGGGGWGFSSYLSTRRWFQRHLHISEYSRSLAGQTTDARATVILGGVDTEKFRPDATVPREPLVLFVGRLLPHKGVDDLIDALPPGLALELIGRPYDEQFAQELSRLADGKPVRFRHDCHDSELVRAYQRALCVVLPSVYRPRVGSETRVPELLGQTLLEGMACGSPAIATRVASLPEVVVDDKTGFLVPPNNPPALRERLKWLRDHPSEAARLGEAGRQRVLEMFSWPTVVQRCLDAYQGARG